MLVCYLDDSGKDPQNRITTVAGFVAPSVGWEAFELTVEPVFQEYKVDVLHAVDLHQGRGCFKGWSRTRKRMFVHKICREMMPFVPIGMSMSALKSAYKLRAGESLRKRTVTPYTFCTNVILSWMLTDIRIGKSANEDGVAIILEAGHQNNREAEINFDQVKEIHDLDSILRSVSVVRKSSCRAIQMADLIAYYSRRHGAAMEQAPITERAKVLPSDIVNIITGCVPVRAFVATDFDRKSLFSERRIRIPPDLLKPQAL